MSPKPLLAMGAAVALAVFVSSFPDATRVHAQDAPPKGDAKGGKAGGKGKGPAVSPLGDGPWELQTEQTKLHVTVVTKVLDHPWALAFLPNGDMLVTERQGRLRLLHNGVLDPTPIAGMPQVRVGVLGGLMDIALHPDYAQNHWVYFTYAVDGMPEPAYASLAVGRGKYTGGTQITDFQQIFVAQPGFGGQTAPADSCCGEGPADASFGSRMVFLADKTFLVTSGDRNHGEYAQNPAQDIGKIIRLKDDGTIPSDNPFVGTKGYRPEIWTIGHRNPLGLTVHPLTGDVWESEFGPNGGDEVNKIEKGKNYGWIQITNGKHYQQNGVEGLQQGPDAKHAGMEDPILYWAPSINPGNLLFYNGSKFPMWKGNLLMGVMGKFLLRVTFDTQGKPIEQERMLSELGQRFRDTRMGPDGNLYIATDETTGAIIKVAPGK